MQLLWKAPAERGHGSDLQQLRGRLDPGRLVRLLQEDDKHIGRLDLPGLRDRKRGRCVVRLLQEDDEHRASEDL